MVYNNYMAERLNAQVFSPKYNFFGNYVKMLCKQYYVNSGDRTLIFLTSRSAGLYMEQCQLRFPYILNP